MTENPNDLLALAHDLSEAGEEQAAEILRAKAAFLQPAPPAPAAIKAGDLLPTPPADNRAGPLHPVSQQEKTLTGAPSHHEATAPTDAGQAHPSTSAPQEDWDSESSFDDWDEPVATAEAHDDWLEVPTSTSKGRPTLQVEVLTDHNNLKNDDLQEFSGNKSVSRITVSLATRSSSPKWQEAD